MGETESPRRIFASVGAVMAGLLITVVLSIGTDGVLNKIGVFHHLGQPMTNPLLILATVYRILYNVVGGYIAARLAPSRPLLHALVLGGIGFILSLAGAVATWNGGAAYAAKWYPLTLIALALPAAWLGGKICQVRLRLRLRARTEVQIAESGS